jgi:restriction system protein
MDFSPMINQIVRMVILYLIPIAILTAILKSPWFKGVAGEFIVNTLAKMIFNKNEYHLIKNVTLPTEDGTTQIDHIIVSKYGIFVVETKNMKGWIFGNPSQKQWTQKIYKHSKQFQNPLNQNYKHVKTIESLFELNDQQVHSVVVFVGDSTFKTEIPENVTYGFGYIRFIKSKNQTVLAKSKVDEIIRKIEEGRLTPSFKTNKEHIEHVKHIVSEKKISNMCPKCGSPMILREAKNGQNAGKQFWGCSKFPQCRSIVNVT